MYNTLYICEKYSGCCFGNTVLYTQWLFCHKWFVLLFGCHPNIYRYLYGVLYKYGLFFCGGNMFWVFNDSVAVFGDLFGWNACDYMSSRLLLGWQQV